MRLDRKRRKIERFGLAGGEKMTVDATESQDEVRIFKVGLEKLGNEIGCDSVVGVDKTDVGAGSVLKSEVASGGLAVIVLVKNFDATILLGELSGKGKGIVGRAIVD